MSKFKRGQFKTYRATNKIHVGKYEMDIAEADEFDYDGQTVRYAGVEYAVPQLQSLLGDWFVVAEDQTTTYQAKPAGVQVSHATPEARERGDTFEMGEAAEEEAVIGTMGEAKQIREAASSGDRNRLAELRAQRAQRKADLGITAAAAEPTEALDVDMSASGAEHAAEVSPDVEDIFMEDAEKEQQFVKATPVHQAGTGNAPAASPSERAEVARAERINRDRIAARQAALEEADPAKTRDEMGGTRHDTADQGGRRAGKGGKYQVIADDAGGVPVGKEYKFSSGATVGDGVVEAGEVKAVNVTKAARRQPVQVGRAVAKTPQNREAGAVVVPDDTQTHQAQAVRGQGSTQVPAEGNVGIDHVGEGGATGDVEVTTAGDDLAALLPDAAGAGRTRPAPPPAKTEDEEIAEIVEGWSTRRNWHKRVEEAVDFYGDWPEAIEAICDKESPKVAAQIRSKLTKQAAAAEKRA